MYSLQLLIMRDKIIYRQLCIVACMVVQAVVWPEQWKRTNFETT